MILRHLAYSKNCKISSRKKEIGNNIEARKTSDAIWYWSVETAQNWQQNPGQDTYWSTSGCQWHAAHAHAYSHRIQTHNVWSNLDFSLSRQLFVKASNQNTLAQISLLSRWRRMFFGCNALNLQLTFSVIDLIYLFISGTWSSMDVTFSNTFITTSL